jgi:hypothetical protein
MQRATGILLAITVVALAGCGREARLPDQIVGTWDCSSEDGAITRYTFSKDGSLSERTTQRPAAASTSPSGAPAEISGRWTVRDGRLLSIDDASGEKRALYHVEMTPDGHMLFKGPDRQHDTVCTRR